jgi:hypothetical protein
MSTENLEGLDEGIDELLGKVASKVTSRRSAIRKERDGRRKHETHIALGAAAALQRSRDKRAVLDEEEEQLDNIQRMAGALLEAAEGTETEEPAQAAEHVHEEPAPSPPEPPVVAPVAGPPPPPPEAVAEPTAVIPAVEEVAVVEPPLMDFREWNGWQWLAAILGAIIGFIVARYTWHPLLGGIHGLGRGFLAVFWWVGMIILGFGLAGYVAFTIRWRRHGLANANP